MQTSAATLIDPDGLLDQSRVAKHLDVSEKCLEAWRVRGGGPNFIKVGRLVRYRNSDIQEWLKSRTVGNTSE